MAQASQSVTWIYACVCALNPSAVNSSLHFHSQRTFSRPRTTWVVSGMSSPKQQPAQFSVSPAVKGCTGATAADSPECGHATNAFWQHQNHGRTIKHSQPPLKNFHPFFSFQILVIRTLKNTLNPYQLFTSPELKFDKFIISHLFFQRCSVFRLLLQK